MHHATLSNRGKHQQTSLSIQYMCDYLRRHDITSKKKVEKYMPTSVPWRVINIEWAFFPIHVKHMCLYFITSNLQMVPYPLALKCMHVYLNIACFCDFKNINFFILTCMNFIPNTKCTNLICGYR